MTSQLVMVSVRATLTHAHLCVAMAGPEDAVQRGSGRCRAPRGSSRQRRPGALRRVWRGGRLPAGAGCPGRSKQRRGALRGPGPWRVSSTRAAAQVGSGEVRRLGPPHRYSSCEP